MFSSTTEREKRGDEEKLLSKTNGDLMEENLVPVPESPL